MKTYKRFIVYAFIAIILITGTGSSQATRKILATPVSFNIFYNDNELLFKMPVVVMEGRTYVPLRELSEGIGMSVDWDAAKQKIDLKNKDGKCDDSLISIMIFPSSAESISYKIELLSNGLLSTTVGRGGADMYIEDKFVHVSIKNFVPKVTRYKNLTTLEMDEILNNILKISIEEKTAGAFALDGWCVVTSYQNVDYQYVFDMNKKYWKGSEHMFETIKELMEYSVIEIITYAYDDPVKSHYYESYDW